MTPTPQSAIRRVLILKPCCLGDVLMATPLAAAIAIAWPQATIDWAVDQHSRPALAGNPNLADQLDATGCIRGHFRLQNYLRLVAEVRRRHYDIAFVPDRAPLLALLPRLAGIPLRVGLDSGGRGWPHTVRVAVGAGRHERELYLELARVLGMPITIDRPLFVPSAEDRGKVRELVGEHWVGPRSAAGLRSAIAAGPMIAIHPGGGVNPGMTLASKRWPLDRFVALMDRLRRTHDARFVLVGSRDEMQLADGILTHVELDPATRAATMSTVGQLSIGQTGAVLESCDLFVGNDSGIAHLATAVGTPAVVIFGPTDPARYGPSPGSGVAVAPIGVVGAVGAEVAMPAERLADAVGSGAIERVSVDQVAEAVASYLKT